MNPMGKVEDEKKPSLVEVEAKTLTKMKLIESTPNTSEPVTITNKCKS